MFNYNNVLSKEEVLNLNYFIYFSLLLYKLDIIRVVALILKCLTCNIKINKEMNNKEHFIKAYSSQNNMSE